MLAGKVYVIRKRTSKGSWVEYYVKIPAKEGKKAGLVHGQTVYISTVDSAGSTVDKKLLDGLVQLFISCFRDQKLARLIVADPQRRALVTRIIQMIEGGEQK